MSLLSDSLRSHDTIFLTSIFYPDASKPITVDIGFDDDSGNTRK